MRIYHYTTIKTLALILKHKTIRFNRLDGVDDPEEFSFTSGKNQTKLFKYIFVSCWTKDSTENIPLWKLYTGNKGVRICLDEDMFKGTMLGKHKCFLPMDINFRGDCIIEPFTNPVKLHDVIYDNLVEQKVEELIREKDGLIHIETGKAGLFKDEKWAFQKESRFKIITHPFPKNIIKSLESNDASKHTDAIQLIGDFLCGMSSAMINNEEIKLQYIDQPLKSDALDDIEVTMGPMTDEADRFIVESLLKDYPRAKVIDSCFKGRMVK